MFLVSIMLPQVFLEYFDNANAIMLAQNVVYLCFAAKRGAEICHIFGDFEFENFIALWKYL